MKIGWQITISVVTSNHSRKCVQINQYTGWIPDKLFPQPRDFEPEKKSAKACLGHHLGSFYIDVWISFFAGGEGCRIGWRIIHINPNTPPQKKTWSERLNFSDFRVLDYRIEVSTLQLFLSKDLLKMHQKASYTSVAVLKKCQFLPIPKTSTFRWTFTG